MKPLPCLILCLAALTLPLVAVEPAKPKIIPNLALDGNVTLGDLIKTLRKETGVDIIVEAGLSESIPAPNLVLKNVTVESVMNALREMLPSLSIKSQGVPPNEIYTISTRTQELPAEAFRRVTRIFKIGGAGLPGAEFDKLLESITTVSDIAALANGRMHNESTFAQCKANMNCTQCHAPGRNDSVFRDFKPIIEAHRPTGLIVVSGMEDKVQLVGQVIEVLGGEAIRGGAGAAPSAARSSALSVKYLAVGEVAEKIKADLGSIAAAAVVSSDARTNSLVLNEAHPDAARVRLFVERLDQRPMTLVVKTEVRRADAAHPEGVVIARPTVATLPGKTATISIGEKEKGDQLTIELTVTPEGTAEGLSSTLDQVREQAEKARKQKDADVQKLEGVLKNTKTGAAPPTDAPSAPPRSPK